MAKGNPTGKSAPALPSLRTYLQPRECYSETRFSEESVSCREDTPAARAVARFAASFGIDTRLGVVCFGVCPQTSAVCPQTSAVTLDLEMLRSAVLACSPDKQARYSQECKRLLHERFLTSQRVISLTQRDVVNIRTCADHYYEGAVNKDLPDGLGPPFEATRKPKDIFHTLKTQAIQKMQEGHVGFATLLSDNPCATSELPVLLSALVGAEVATPLSCHVRLGLRPTSQRLRTREEYAEDSAQVGTAVEEMEFLVGQAYVPRPPPLLLVPMQLDEIHDMKD